ncbi:MAG: hypothetical protein KDB22_24880 [Planctomycetales bacterium]|nr:hypothetical protein [Planctomycetales bacterium]
MDRIRTLLAVLRHSLAVCLSIATAVCWADPPNSLWDSLPDTTLGAARVLGNEQLITRFREETKFGAVLFSSERTETLAEAIRTFLSQYAEDLNDKLDQYEIELTELPAIFAGESGVALLAADQSAPDSSCVAIWLNPGPEMSQRLWDALELWLDENADDESEIQVIEVEVGGARALNIQWPTYEYIFEDDDEEAQFELNYQNWLLVQQEGRLIAVTGNSACEPESVDDHTQWLSDILVDLLQPVATMSGRFAQMARIAGGESALGQDEDLFFEVAGDIGQLVEWSREFVPEEEIPEVNKALQLFDVDSIRSMVMRITLGEQIMRTFVTVDWPEPRSGIPKILGQNQAPIAPPAWIPASVVSYSQFNFDLANAYRTIHQEILAAFPEAAPGFQMAEDQTRAVTKHTIEEILASLGQTAYSIQLPLDLTNLDVELIDDESAVQEPTALVWQLKDEALWKDLMRILGGFAPMMNMEPTDEQGFTGFRLNNGLIQGGIVIGRGQLVFAVGEEMLETVLVKINNPPRGTAAFRNSELFEQAGRLTEFRPVTTIEVSDGNRVFKTARDALLMMSTQFAADEEVFDDSEDSEMSETFVDALITLLPDDDEVENILGVVVTELLVDERGLTLHSINELPPPE